MSVDELKKKYPVIYWKDHGEGLTLWEIATRLGRALDAHASTESTREIAADVLDRDFLFGAWGDKWVEADLSLLRDLRGMIVAAYRAGQASRTK